MFNTELKLTDEQRKLLARKIELDIEINKVRAELLPAMLDSVKNPGADKEETINFLSSLRLTELRREQSEVVGRLVESAIDMDKLMEMLPAALMALSFGVNVPLLLKLSNIDPDQIKILVDRLKKFLSM